MEKVPENIPSTPGIYKMLDETNRVIYIGKAKDLKKRVRQYFQKDYQHSSRTRKLMEHVVKIDTISVDSDLEAMILESNLIKQFQPKYNVIMKDDKNYVYIRITKEDFPRIQIVRQIEKDGAKYLGPKTAKHKVADTLKLLKKLFPFRHCGLDIAMLDETNPIETERVHVTRKVLKYPCLDFFIKRCSAPCIGKVTREDYAEIIRKVEQFLEGHADEILRDLKEEMVLHAQNRQFERAAKLRDKILKIESILEKQKVANTSHESVDIINYCIIQEQAYFSLFQVRDGKLMEQENFTLSATAIEDEENPEILEAFLNQYYQIATDIPPRILLPYLPENNAEIELFLTNETSKKIKISAPKRGDKEKLLELALKNAQIYADRSRPSWKVASEDSIDALKHLQQVLNLAILPKRIECYDISHLGGTNTVASMIVFKNGAPDKAHYRKFNIRTVEHGKPDDYASMEEVLNRRLNHLARQYQFKDYKLLKAKKADDSLIQEQSLKNEVNRSQKDYKEFHVLRNSKDIVGFGRIVDLNEKTSLLKTICIIEEHRKQGLGHKLLEELIRKAKGKRVYVICRAALKHFYESFGFEALKAIPKDLQEEYADSKNHFSEELFTYGYDKMKLKQDASFSEIPDLIIIDGGKGQLAVATRVLAEKNLQIAHISLAKRLEEIFTPSQSQSILLPTNHQALRLLQRARDEAHRFAITFQKSKRAV